MEKVFYTDDHDDDDDEDDLTQILFLEYGKENTVQIKMHK